jgi:two-component sensor histidine kinase
MLSNAERKPKSGSRPRVTLSFSLDSEVEAPWRARRVLQQLGPAVPSPVLHDLGVVVTELVSNAVRFGPPASIGVTVEVEADGQVLGEVVDGGVGGAVLDRSRPLRHGGLGLQMVDALCADWGAQSDPSRVWFRIEPSEDDPR